MPRSMVSRNTRICVLSTRSIMWQGCVHAIGKEQHFGDLFGAVSEENVARIKRQNKKKISVVIGNPPYNANQMTENENNKNREYPAMDQRIKETYIDASTAQKTKLYDM